ncbi:MAG: sugar phosphate isomerase/epimerase [Clostridia bacterium]|nr:sugar phosphate isomerase/epimerase [Clostridia bacterium]
MKNPIGIYYAYWEKEWSADFLPYIKKVKELGFDDLEINAGAVVDMTSAERKNLAAAAKDAGITLSYCIGLPAKYDLSSADSAVRKAGSEFVGKMLDGIHEMDGKVIGGIIYATWPMVGAPTYDEKMQMRARSIESLREILKKAEQYDIKYCLEIVNRFEQCIMNTAAEGVEYLRELGSPNAKLLLDTFHMNIEEDSIGDAIRSAKGYVGHFHIGEPNRKTPGTGRMPWGEIFGALKCIDYDGMIVMEPFIKAGGQVGKDIKVFRDLSNNASAEEMDEMAAAAASFVKRG